MSGERPLSLVETAGWHAAEEFAVVGVCASADDQAFLKEFFASFAPGAAAAFAVCAASAQVDEIADGLARVCPFPVLRYDREAEFEPGRVYCFPANAEGADGAFDQFLRELANLRREGAFVVVADEGFDCARGLKAIRQAGGIVFARDGRSGDVASSGQSVHELADVTLPTSELASRVARAIGQPGGLADEDMWRIIAQLRLLTGADFSKYKRSALRRRIVRRMLIRGSASTTDYIALLKQNHDEVFRLRADLEPSAAGFFQDPAFFARLAKDVVPLLFDETGGPIRVWVPGCATGEEAYSLAMLLLEEAARRETKREIQIFASDLDGVALAKAREGRYPLEAGGEIDGERWPRFFTCDSDLCRVRRELRDIIVFARHDLLEDPPFSRIDLIACRNVLAQLTERAQREVCETFHFALRPRGLLLGPPEGAAASPGLFSLLDRESRIYRRLGPSQLPARSDGREDFTETPPRRSEEAAHRSSLERLGPPSILVDENYRVVHMTETAGRYLQPSGGPLANNLLHLAREELRPGLRLAFHCAFLYDETSLNAPVLVDLNGERRRVQTQVKPAGAVEGGRAALVFFIEGEAGTESLAVAEQESPQSSEEQTRKLQFELQMMRSKLDMARVESDLARQDRQADQDALQALGENYRAVSEELDLNKEEMQAISQELNSVNKELKLRLDAETQALADVRNLMVATDINILFLDRELRIKKFTPRLAEQFNIRLADEGRSIAHFTNLLDYPDLADDARAVMENFTTAEREVRGRDGCWLLVRLRPYCTVDHRVDGVVLTFLDITERHVAADALRESEARVRSVIDGVADAIVTADETGRIQWINRATSDMFGFSPEELIGLDISNLMPEPHRSQHQSHIENYLRTGESHIIGIGREVEAQRKDGSRFPAELTISETEHKGQKLFIGFLRDLSVQRRYEARLQKLHENRLSSMANMAAELAHELNQPLTAAANYLCAAQRRLERDCGGCPVDIGKTMQSATDQVLRAGRIVHRLRHFISHGEPNHSLHSLHGLIANVCELMAPALRESNVEVVLHLGAAKDQVLADGVQMEQVMVNLLRNAEEAMRDSAVRRLTVSTSLKNGAIKVDFADTGRGLSAMDRCDLFLPFTTTKSEGLGVGLSISRSILEAHSGQMWAESNADGGATFSFTLPLAPTVA